MNVAQRVARNTIFLAGSQVFVKAVNFVFTIFLARLIGAQDFGKYSFVAVLFGMLSLLANFGFESFIIRDIARDNSSAKSYLWNSLVVKLAVSAFIMLSVLSLFGFPGVMADPVKKQCLLVSCFILFFNCITQTMWSLTDAHEKMQYHSIANAFYNLGRAAVGLGLVFMGYGLTALFAGLLAVEALVMVPVIVATDRAVKLPGFSFDAAVIRSLIGKAWPFCLLGFLGMVYFRVDIFILSWMKGDEAVGWYNAAYGFLVGLMFVPDSLISALFPVMSRYHKDSEKALRLTYRKSTKYLLILGLPLAAGTIILSEKIITVFYGSDYANSVLALRILGVAMLFVFINAPLGRMLFSVDRQKDVLKLSVVTVSANIALNFLAIPWFSYVGSSVVTVISEIMSSLIFFSLLSRLSYESGIIKELPKPLAACLAMCAAVYFARQMNLFILALLGGCVYFMALLAMKAFDADDEYLLKRIFQRT